MKVESRDGDGDVDGINIIQLHLQPNNEKTSLSNPVDELKQADESTSNTSYATDIPSSAAITISAREVAMLVDDKKTPNTDKES